MKAINAAQNLRDVTLRIKSSFDIFVYLLNPIGSVYISFDPTDPGTLYGGKWERLKEVFLFAADDQYTVGSSGGEETHMLTEAELPKIKGDVEFRPYDGNGSIFSELHNDPAQSGAFSRVANGGNIWNSSLQKGPTTGKNVDVLHLAFGGGQPHNNMPPYLAVYVWKRTA